MNLSNILFYLAYTFTLTSNLSSHNFIEIYFRKYTYSKRYTQL